MGCGRSKIAPTVRNGGAYMGVGADDHIGPLRGDWIAGVSVVRRSGDGVTFLSPNKKVTKEVGFPGAELLAPAIKAAPVPRAHFRRCSTDFLLPWCGGCGGVRTSQGHGNGGADGKLIFPPHPTSLTLGHRFLKECLPPASIPLKDSLRSATPPGEGF